MLNAPADVARVGWLTQERRMVGNAVEGRVAVRKSVLYQLAIVYHIPVDNTSGNMIYFGWRKAYDR